MTVLFEKNLGPETKATLNSGDGKLSANVDFTGAQGKAGAYGELDLVPMGNWIKSKFTNPIITAFVDFVVLSINNLKKPADGSTPPAG